MSASEQPGATAQPKTTAQGDTPDEAAQNQQSPAPTPTPAARARRARIAAASVLMAAAAVVLALRLASRSSVLVVGVYGLLLILCGGVIELSRRGRTRLGTYLLAAGLAAALFMDGFVLS
ncbi:hypothetical protein ACFVYR_21595 [Streptomyces sp. NPDC058284]|uniref:hypothetical protein n=1 Tax=unclassified Streptomyces TaxID=2593676 RepID=UPI0036613723